MEQPLILLTNDDGVDSPYLETMASAMRANLGAEVIVLAPERQRSAMSHSITLHKPLRIEERRSGVYAVSGSPVDCVYIGILKVASRRPDLVVSGPNDGFNLGTDVFYSGTVGAAIEGGLRGIPSIAVSLATESPDALPHASNLVCSVAQGLWQQPEAGTVINLNVPTGCEGKARWTSLGRRFYEDDVQQRTDPRNRKYYWIGGGVAGIDDRKGSDCQAVLEDRVASISPLHLDLTKHSMLETEVGPWPLLNFELG